ncbi:hypothetical protein [Salipaludibacillus daqingensis]|uniref:hypothetical protein n=1 Tax=Salipaludibacillus daqingensis TaxID=3041001 RepID=UPI0024742F57|nr:hypothetical protein [Salipaludibacillus daqingensis]
MKGNAIVLLLPATVMIGLFIFGYITLSQTEEVSNEDLKESLSINEEIVDHQTLKINWQWGDFPEDGIRGEDFLEIALPDGTEEMSIETELILTQGDDIVYESNHFVKSDGSIIISFPNEVQDEQILGPSGEVVVRFSETVLDQRQGNTDYYHTWYDHNIQLKEGMDIEETLIGDHIQSYWKVSTS